MSNLSTQRTSLKGLLESDNVKKRIQEVQGKNAASFVTSIIQIANSSQMLADAEPSSIVSAAMTAATLNLPLNNALGLAYIVPFKEKQKDGSYLTKGQFMLGWKGLVRLAQRSGQFVRLNSGVVKEGEIVSFDRLTGDIKFNWEQDDEKREQLKPIGYFAYFKLVNGYEHTYYMTMKEMDAHAKKYSQTYKKGFGIWKDDYESMANKTVLKLLISKFAPLSIEMASAVEKDQAVLDYNDDDGTIDVTSYPDNETPEVDPDMERMREYITSAKTHEELDDTLVILDNEGKGELFVDEIKAKRKELNKQSKK